MDGRGAIVRHESTVEAILNGNLADNERNYIAYESRTTNARRKCVYSERYGV